MKLAASNIAWDVSEDDAAAAALRDAGFAGVEIAPSKRWESPLEASPREVAAYREEWRRRGFQVVALQSLLFGRPDLKLFGSASDRKTLREFMISMVELAAGLEARSLVFGSPRNRKLGGKSLSEGTEIAAEFFREVGTFAAARGCTICIEPNPVEYDCDFLTTTDQAVAFCELVGSKGVGVNGDAGTLAMSHEDPKTSLSHAADLLRHFHASEPNLVEVGSSAVHREAATVLRQIGYGGWVSIEMRAAKDDAIAAVARAASSVRGIYGS
jgi:sugar phosphate isomerase/epimerase